MKQEFRASNGKPYTRQLFWDEWINLSESEKSIQPVFTLYRDKPNLINFRRAYVDREDPTGYIVSQDLLGDYDMWQLLMKCTWFQAAKKVWDEELDSKLASRGLRKIQELMNDGLPAQQLAAAKYLANKEHRKDKTASKGRPNKQQVEEAAREEAAFNSHIDEDFKRLTLVK